MSDQEAKTPRVERLRYVAQSRGAIHFRKTHMDDNAPMLFADDGPTDPIVGDTDDFQVTLHDGRATVEMLSDYATTDEARSAVEPYLRAWEIQSFLHHVEKHNDLQQPLIFQFDGADVANPVPGPPVVIHAELGQGFFYRAYPPPPHDFVASEDVRDMWLRWQEYQADREPLPSMAFYCLTVVEASVGGPRRGQRQRAATRYAVASEVLDKLGDLVSEVGEERERRKAHAKDKRPYSSDERNWMERVTLALIRRVGEVAHFAVVGASQGVQLTPLTMANFPQI